MAISLYDATVPSFLQILEGVTGFLGRARKYCEENGKDPNEFIGTRLHPDMLPFSFQLNSVVHHSLGAIEGVKAGEFHPPTGMSEPDYAGFQEKVAAARESLAAFGREEIDALQGKDVIFRLGERSMPFIAEDFLLSFSLPNFYFHATTAYDILRVNNVPLGKRDFLGRMRMKG